MVFGLFRKLKARKAKKAGKAKKARKARKPGKAKRKKAAVKKKGPKGRKKPKKKGAAKKKAGAAAVKKAKKVILEPELIGEITHYFPHVKAGVIQIASGRISVGDTLRVKGHTTDFKQKVVSMQINHVPVKSAEKGDDIGLRVKRRVRRGDSVYRA